MVGETGNLHCTWCGAPAIGGKRFCSECGKPLLDMDESTTTSPFVPTKPVPASSQRLFIDALDEHREQQEHSKSIINKLGDVISWVVAVPLALIATVVSILLPILIIVGLVIGPANT